MSTETMAESAPAAPEDQGQSGGHGFGWPVVFMAGISTILGAIMFLRFGYAVGQAGLLGAIGIIIIGHMVTIPTALAIAEIATNRKVEGGGEYFIISRSFGRTIGSVIGFPLYLSQAVSVAFYMIAFAEAFQPLSGWIQENVGFYDPRMLSVPGTLALIVLMLTKGADLGVRVLYVVVLTLMLSLIMFFLGGPVEGFETQEEGLRLLARTENPDQFFVVFAICFPAFTGMTAGVGLSGDLANPRRSIPLGTMLATIIGMVTYVAIVLKLSMSAPVDELANNQLVMADIALWGPMILIGLGAATLSSAIGSILVAPRTLQALAADGAIPGDRANKWLAAGVGASNEPRNATIVTAVMALVIVLLGNVDFVARIISMFFMVTYGALCAISFLEHFAARPSYRPSFRSKWYISLFGALACVFMMFQMDPIYALVALVLMVILYFIVRRSQGSGQDDLADMFRGVMTQATRYMQLQLQRTRRSSPGSAWRPSIIMVNDRTFDRRAHFEMLNWLCHRHGFGTYIHFHRGHLNRESLDAVEEVRDRLLALRERQKSAVYMDTVISPSMLSALAQSLQLPGVFGMNNNMTFFEFSSHDGDKVVDEIMENCLFSDHARMNQIVLRHADMHFGQRREIHIWLTWNDSINANLMVLLSYILLGHPDWRGAEIRVFAALPSGEVDERRANFLNMIAEGRIPVAEKNIRFFSTNSAEDFDGLVEAHSSDADLVVMGFNRASLITKGKEVFTKHPDLADVLFVSASEDILIE